MLSSQIRSGFLDFFKSKGHIIRPGSSLVPPPGDTSLLFTTAGMLQFKPLWAGAPLPFKRAATIQKCLRAGGKASDLENVGKTLRHHTFFEMLGNFSFGDYFKKDAVLWAWEFLKDVLKMPEENIWVSVYAEDEEAFSIWKDVIGIDAKKIRRLGRKDNFWGPAGDTGACGPCSEIYFDIGPSYGCGSMDCGPGCSCERYLEFWNLVFPQFYKEEDGSMIPLKRRGIDTGMGLERLAFLMQDDAKNNYETDLFKPLIGRIKKFAKTGYNGNSKASFHIIADHIRALASALGEGIMPSNTGRGYVLRRLLRRAVRHGRKIGIRKPFLFKLSSLIEENKQTQRVILTEEERFQRTIDCGLSIIEDIISSLKKKRQDTISGSDIFRLYDTFGFPADLLSEIAEENGLRLDYAGFNSLMGAQKKRAKDDWAGAQKGDAGRVYLEIQKKRRLRRFTGYGSTSAETKVAAVVDNKELFLEETPFYAERGGQAGDTGWIKGESGEAEVTDTQIVLPGVISHRIKMRKGAFTPGCAVCAEVDAERRIAISRHHTATHILQYSLRRILGDHIKQAGSFVSSYKLRFDFTHFADISREELLRIEELVNEKIMEDTAVLCREMPIEEALRHGALAFFGEKYSEKVRVVNIGGYSIELCGGTHLKRTGQAGLFRIVSEASAAAGIRRIEAVCGVPALRLVNAERREIEEICRILKAEEKDITNRIRMIAEENKKISGEMEKIELNQIRQIAGQITPAKFNGINLVCKNVRDVSPSRLRVLSDILKNKIKSGIIVLGSSYHSRCTIITAVTDDLIRQGWHAGRIVKETAAYAEGKGGGKPGMGQAGCGSAELMDKALCNVPDVLNRIIALLNCKS